MSTDVVVARSASEKRRLAELAIEAQLYQSGWMLKQELQNLSGGHNVHCMSISVASKNGTPIGVSVYFIPSKEGRDVFSPFHDDVVICYVRLEYRRMGVGRKLVNSFGVAPDKLISYRGDSGSPDFWTKIGTDYRGMFGL